MLGSLVMSALLWFPLSSPAGEGDGQRPPPKAQIQKLIGKTEAEVIERLGPSEGRMEMGDEIRLTFHQGTFVFKEGKLTRVEPRVKGRDDAASLPAVKDPRKSEREEMKEEHKAEWLALEEKLEDKKKEIQEKMKGKTEAMKKFETDFTGNRTDYEKRQESKRLDDSLGIDALKKEMLVIQEEIKDLQKKAKMELK